MASCCAARSDHHAVPVVKQPAHRGKVIDRRGIVSIHEQAKVPASPQHSLPDCGALSVILVVHDHCHLLDRPAHFTNDFDSGVLRAVADHQDLVREVGITQLPNDVQERRANTSRFVVRGNDDREQR